MSRATDTSIGTPISAANLEMRGYREYPPNTMIDRCDRLYQRFVSDEHGKLYFLNFREWNYDGKTSWDAELACDTETGGHVWATVKEETIERAEELMAVLWKAAGGVRYD